MPQAEKIPEYNNLHTAPARCTPHLHTAHHTCTPQETPQPDTATAVQFFGVKPTAVILRCGNTAGHCTGGTLIIAVTLVTGAILFTWATLSTTPTDISLSTGAIGVTLATEALLFPGLQTPFFLLGVLYLLAILVLHLLLVLIGQLKLLVLFLLLALVTSFEQKSLCT